MKAAICTKYGSPDVLRILEVPVPKPGKKDLLVKIHASAVNSGDVRVRCLDVKGVMKVIMKLVLGISKPRKPILGTVFSGIVESVGNQTFRYKLGDKVFGMTGFNFGTHAEYIAVKESSNVLPMPENASFEDAAAIIFGAQTAIYFLEKAKLAEQQKAKILIIGATGSVGAAAVQIAKYYKADVTAVCSSSGGKFVNDLGVTNIIFYDQQGFENHAKKYDIIFDAVGKTIKKQMKSLLVKNGVFVSVAQGYASESLTQLKLVKELFEKGYLVSTIDKVFSLDAIAEAHTYVDTGRKKGNVVIKII